MLILNPFSKWPILLTGVMAFEYFQAGPSLYAFQPIPIWAASSIKYALLSLPILSIENGVGFKAPI